MIGSDHRNDLMAAFLVEGWDVLAGIEESVAGLATPFADRASEMLALLAHRLRGSAALYGLERISAVASGMLRCVDGSGPEDSPSGQQAFLVAAVGELHRALQAVEKDGLEPGDLELRLENLHPGFLSEPVEAEELSAPAPLETPLSEPEVEPPALETSDFALAEPTPEPKPEVRSVADELASFVQEHGDTLEYFGPEADEHLEGLVQALDPGDNSEDDRVGVLFRRVHTLKGAAYTVGCKPIGDLSHSMEDVLMPLRDQRLPLTSKASEALQEGTTLLRHMLNVVRGAPAGSLGERYQQVESHLRAVLFDPRADQPEAADALLVAAEPATPFVGSSSLSDVDALPAQPIIPAAQTLPAPAARALAPKRREAPSPPSNVFRSTIRVNLDRIDRLVNLAGELVMTRGRVETTLRKMLGAEALMEGNRRRLESTVRDFEEKYLNPELRTSTEAEYSAKTETPLRFPSPDRETLSEIFAEMEFDRYDDFNILSRRIAELSSDQGEALRELSQLLRELERESTQLQQLTRDLRTGLSRTRMVPIGQLFSRFTRLVRSMASGAEKNVNVEVSGESVELDNLIVEQIADPLMHLVQNAVTHGIEPETERTAAGKPPQGTLSLVAASRGQFIEIEVRDDGSGIDLEALRQQAIRSGLQTEDSLTDASEADLMDLIYLPGVSTSASVTQSAGRGVGMDVVRTNLARVSGEIDIETTPGEGTSFVLRVPLTLAISEALMVVSGDQTFALQITTIKAMMEVDAATLVTEDDATPTVLFEDNPIPVFQLRQILGTPQNSQQNSAPIIVLRTGGRTFGLVVDEMQGIQEVVIRSLGPFLTGSTFFAGATISNDGQLVLLLDPSIIAQVGLHGALPSWQATPVAQAQAGELVDAGHDGAILLVDDSLSVRKVLGKQLTRAGFEVTTASDGEEALERLRADTFDALITDLEMPKLNGYELIDEVRLRPALRELPIFVITTRAGSKHHDLAKQLGADGFFTKPIDEDTLVGHLREAIPEVRRLGGVG